METKLQALAQSLEGKLPLDPHVAQTSRSRRDKRKPVAFDADTEEALTRAFRMSKLQSLASPQPRPQASAPASTATGSGSSSSSQPLDPSTTAQAPAAAVTILNSGVQSQSQISDLVRMVSSLANDVASLKTVVASNVGAAPPTLSMGPLGAQLASLAGFEANRSPRAILPAFTMPPDVSDSDDDDDALNNVAPGDASVSVSSKQSLLKEALRGIHPFGSFGAWVRHIKFGSTRNERECASWAQALDCLLAGHSNVAVDHMIRRLSAVQLADATGGNWTLAEAIEQRAPKDSFLSQSTVNGWFRLADRIEKLNKVPSAGKSGGVRGSSPYHVGASRASSATTNDGRSGLFTQQQFTEKSKYQQPYPSRTGPAAASAAS
jgi:hypothetical protein